MKNIEWIFFDFGSTLVDETKAYEHRFREIAERAGCSYEEVYQGALAFYKQNKKGDYEIAKKYGLEKPKWHKEDEFLYEGVPELLEQLSKQYKIGIIANQPLGTEDRLKEFGILPYIDLVVASAEEGVEKPKLRIFEIALERSGCPAECAVMVGDRIDNDIIPAKKLGIHTVWVKQGYGKYWIQQNAGEVPEVELDNVLAVRDVFMPRTNLQIL